MWGDFLFWFLLILSCGFRGAGGAIRELLGRWSEILCLGRRVGGGGLMNFLDGGSEKIFNRSPITLKFEARKKREGESIERERERERER